jgi:tetraacyldisaccharide 4'-kinase
MGFIKIILFPFACLFGLVTDIRNKLFDWRIIRSRSYNIPVISVGNLSAGGTGKTPHTEYLVRLLKNEFKIAILSRGYRRKTKGFILASPGNSSIDIGDEPVQYVNKFPDVTVAVDENRNHGIKKILSLKPETQVILLDDAFQHRYVKPGKSILLTDYHHLYVHDYLIPTGMLRERAKGAKRADLIIITKTPKIFSPITRRQIAKDLKPKPHQKLFYSFITYDQPVPLKISGHKNLPAGRYNYIVMVAGVANSYPLQEYLKSICNELLVIDFDDHHSYTPDDLEKITKEFHSIISKDKVIFTTEKDATRLDVEEFSAYLENLPVYYIPMRINFHDCDEVKFDKLILEYVHKSI